MLHAVAQLAQNILWHVSRVLRDEINADPFGPDQTRDLFDLINQGLGRVIKQQMRLIKEEHELGFIRVADLGQFFEQFRKQPQQERRIEARAVHQLIRRQKVDLPTTVGRHLHHVHQVQGRFAKERRCTLIFQHQQLPLDRTDRRRRDVPIAQCNLARVFTDPKQHGLQVFEVQEREALFVGDAEHDVQNALLDVGQFQHPRQQQGPHFGNGGAHRVALVAVEVPEGHWKFVVLQVKPDGRCPLHERIVEFELRRTSRRQPRQIALNIRKEHRNARSRKPLGQNLQRHRLTRARRTSDQAVTVRVVQQKPLLFSVAFATPADKNRVFHNVP